MTHVDMEAMNEINAGIEEIYKTVTTFRAS